LLAGMAQVLGSNFKSSGVQVKFLALPMSFNLGGVPKACKVTSVVVLPKKKEKKKKKNYWHDFLRSFLIGCGLAFLSFFLS